MMEKLSVKELGQLVDLLMRGEHLTDAQRYLSEMQGRLDLQAEMVQRDMLTKAMAATEPNPILAELPTPKPGGIVYDDDGKILAISAQEGERGYDPDAHEKEIRIFLNGAHIETAHTADVEAGTIKYYYRDERSRMKTGEKSGKVEIKAENL